MNLLSFIHPSNYIQVAVLGLITTGSLFVSMSAFWVFLQITALVIWILRNPDRSYLENPKQYLSPVEGIIKSIDYECIEGGLSWTKITIKTGRLDCHMQYAPISGALEYTKLHKPIHYGRWGKLSEIADQALGSILCETVLVYQIKDIINQLECIVKVTIKLDNVYLSCLQIINQSPLSEKSSAVTSLGILSVASDIITEVYLPTGTTIRPLSGQRVFAGETVLGYAAEMQIISELNRTTQSRHIHEDGYRQPDMVEVEPSGAADQVWQDPMPSDME